MTGLKYRYFTLTNILMNVGTNHWWLLALEKNRDTHPMSFLVKIVNSPMK